MADSPTPTKIAVRGTAIGIGVTFLTRTVMAQAINTPISPPLADSSDDSIRNCRRMSPLRAPSDLRMPISCVRSVTTASMMFMITTPPTTMNTDTTAIAVAAIACVRRSHSRMSDAEVRIMKLSSCSGGRCRWARISTRTSSFAWSRCS